MDDGNGNGQQQQRSPYGAKIVQICRESGGGDVGRGIIMNDGVESMRMVGF